MATAHDHGYTKLSLAANAPLRAVEAFNEAFGYATEAQCLALRVAIINDNDALIAGIVRDLYAAAIKREEGEIADKAELEAADRADKLRDIRKDAASLAFFSQQVAV